MRHWNLVSTAEGNNRYLNFHGQSTEGTGSNSYSHYGSFSTNDWNGRIGNALNPWARKVYPCGEHLKVPQFAIK
jgi:hypothetical protein